LILSFSPPIGGIWGLLKDKGFEGMIKKFDRIKNLCENKKTKRREK